MAAVIATAFVIISPATLDESSWNLDLPKDIKDNMKYRLLEYLRALAIDGYEKRRKRKVFIVGNTGTIYNTPKLNIYESKTNTFVAMVPLSNIVFLNN